MNKEKRDAYLLQTILFSLIAAGIIFGYFILKGKGFFVVVDDFNEQQLTFATAVWNMIHSGNIGEWSWNIDLGSSFINTFSFYDLSSHSGRSTTHTSSSGRSHGGGSRKF